MYKQIQTYQQKATYKAVGVGGDSSKWKTQVLEFLRLDGYKPRFPFHVFRRSWSPVRDLWKQIRRISMILRQELEEAFVARAWYKWPSIESLQHQSSIVEAICCNFSWTLCVWFMGSALLLLRACSVCFAGLGGPQAERTGTYNAVWVWVNDFAADVFSPEIVLGDF